MAAATPSKEDIITAVKKYPFLWGVSHKDHSDKRAMYTAWQEIAKEIGGTEDDLKSKWRNMRDYYRKEVRKLQRLQSRHEGTPVKSNWPLFPLLSFLKDTIVLNDTSDTNISLDADPFLEIVESVQEVEPNLYPVFKSTADLEELLKDDDSGTNDTTDSPSNKPSFSKRNSSKRSHQTDYKRKLLELEARKIAIIEKEITDDEDLLFFKSLLPDFKSLPRNRKIYLKLKYQEMLYNEISSLQFNTVS